MHACALIPCYNEGLNIAEVVSGIHRYVKDVIVIDDGSTDETSKQAESMGAIVLRHPLNKGKGESLKTGFEYIKGKKEWEAVFILDGDGQHDWNEIPRFIEAIKSKNTSIVVGDRLGVRKPENMPFVRWMTNKITSLIISKLIKQYVPDSQCGYKLIKTDVLRDLELKTSRYDAESEILIQASRKGYKIISVPISSIYKNEVSNINPFRDTIRFIKLIYGAIFRT